MSQLNRNKSDITLATGFMEQGEQINKQKCVILHASVFKSLLVRNTAAYHI